MADITDKADRSTAYGLISATFAASLVTSPALGAWISESWGDDSVVLLVCVSFRFFHDLVVNFWFQLLYDFLILV